MSAFPLSPNPFAPRTSRLHPVTEFNEEFQRLLNGTQSVARSQNAHFYVYSTSLADGRGDVFVALGLARALDKRGWGVSFSAIEDWEKALDPATTVTISMLSGAAPWDDDHPAVRIGWVRNATDEWVHQPHLQDFDALLASSALSADRLRSVFDGAVDVMPIAVDPELFQDRRLERSVDVCVTASYWGHERRLFEDLRNLGSGIEVEWYGQNLTSLEGIPPHVSIREPVDYLAIPNLYARSKIVLDDVAPAAREHGSQNSRLFEALAAGALVVTNLDTGLSELGLDEVPVVHDQEDLEDLLRHLLEDPQELRARAQRLRAIVMRDHTFAQRAETFCEFLKVAQVNAVSRHHRSRLRRENVRLSQQVLELSEEVMEARAQLQDARDEISRFRNRLAVRVADRIAPLLPHRPR